MKLRHILLLLLCAGALRTARAADAPQPPRLVVNLVVGSMRAEDLTRYAARFGQGGFRRLTEGGVVYADSRYDYLHTLTPVSLATLTTGVNPSVHGVVAERWVDYVTNEAVDLTTDPSTMGLGCDDGIGNRSPRNLVAPTLGEALQQSRPASRVVSVALDATSAVVMGGYTRNVFWLDHTRGNWATSSFYTEVLPAWIKQYNEGRSAQNFVRYTWDLKFPREEYVNSHAVAVSLNKPERLRKQDQARDAAQRDAVPLPANDAERMLRTPAGNAIVLDFAKQAVAQLSLGADATPDLLNICLDASRHIAECYGPESIEMEDTYYRLDEALADFLDFLFAQVPPGEVLVVLTSDHGTSPSYDTGIVERDRFNAKQFGVIINSFLSAQHGPADWVLDYENRNLYLNHTLIYNKGMNLAQVQNEAATFAMQFRGVSHALSSTAMRSSYFGNGYGEKMQNSFYPRRSGDVVINLMPGWIEEREGCRSASGSMYGYDTCVPLVFYGGGIPARRVGRTVEMTAVAPTLAHRLGIPAPAASEGAVLEELRIQ